MEHTQMAMKSDKKKEEAKAARKGAKAEDKKMKGKKDCKK
jgi:hypothetical protein